MTNWDVIVIGAGQAGCAAAWDLAAAGLKVMILSRDPGTAKPCAGGLTEKALQRLRFSVAPVIRESIDSLHVSRYPAQARVLQAATRFCAMTERAELDRFCLQQAQAQGAVFQQITGIGSVVQDASGVRVTCRQGHGYQASWLIAADGANSRVRRLLGEPHYLGAMAIEGHVRRENLQHYPGMTLDFAAIRGGYGWLFPKGDHVNVGLYVWRHGIAAPDRAALDRYCRQRLGTVPDRVAGYPLGTWLTRVRLQQGRVLFAGDAAGCTEPLMGEGIYGAVLSGQMAAEALVCGQPYRYAALMADWREELKRVDSLSALFYRTSALSVPLLQHWIGPSLVDGFSRGLTLGQCKRRWRGAVSG